MSNASADRAIMDLLATYGEEANRETVWRVQGNAVISHKVLERIAVKAGVTYDVPTILRAERDEAVILVTGYMGERREWSIGEAVIGANYRVSGKQAAYPYAMAEKRAKDRVILKLVNLHGLAYSEEEADDFKAPRQQEAATSDNVVPLPTQTDGDGPGIENRAATKSSAQLKKDGAWDAVEADFWSDMQDVQSLFDLGKLREQYRGRARREGWTRAWGEALANLFDTEEERLKNDPAELLGAG